MVVVETHAGSSSRAAATRVKEIRAVGDAGTGFPP
jgi:hypothetical protein